MATNISLDGSPLSSNDVMSLLGYRSRASFWAAVHAQNIPHLKINARRIVFPRRDFEEWFNSRKRGAEVSA